MKEKKIRKADLDKEVRIRSHIGILVLGFDWNAFADRRFCLLDQFLALQYLGIVIVIRKHDTSFFLTRSCLLYGQYLP